MTDEARSCFVGHSKVLWSLSGDWLGFGLTLGSLMQLREANRGRPLGFKCEGIAHCAGAFAAASAMIAFGAVLGKATPTQVLWLTFIMVRGRLTLHHSPTNRVILQPADSPCIWISGPIRNLIISARHQIEIYEARYPDAGNACSSETLDFSATAQGPTDNCPPIWAIKRGPFHRKNTLHAFNTL